MAKLIPLISSGVAGPLGVVHLPRLWQKVLLSASGQLADGYDECGQGFDQMVLDGLKINRDDAIKHIKENKPTYPQFEKWVIDTRGGAPSADEINALNDSIRGYNHGDETRGSILSAAGVEDTGAIKDAVNLNNIDDWTEFHASIA